MCPRHPASGAEEEPRSSDAADLHLLLCLGIDFDLPYLPHLCRHYASAVSSWNVVLHTTESGLSGKRKIRAARHRLIAGIQLKARR